MKRSEASVDDAKTGAGTDGSAATSSTTSGIPGPVEGNPKRDFLVPVEVVRAMAGVTETGYLRMKAMGEGPREVVHIREEVYVLMHDLTNWMAVRDRRERREAGTGPQAE